MFQDKIPKNGPLLSQVWMKATHSFRRRTLCQWKRRNDERKGVSEDWIYFMRIWSFFSAVSHELYMRILRIYGQDDPLKMSSGSWGLSGCFLLPFLPSLFISILPLLPLPPSTLLVFLVSFLFLSLWVHTVEFLNSMATHHQKQQAQRQRSGHSPNLRHETS